MVGTARARARWMAQFSDDDLDLAAKILDKITYYSSINIRVLVRELVQSIFLKYDNIHRKRILFIPIGNAHEGSSIIARALREEIPEENIIHMLDLLERDPTTYNMIVFLDDFSGTGSQIRDFWDANEPFIRPRVAHYIFALLVVNQRARATILEIADVMCVHELNENYNVLSPTSDKFTPEEKLRIRYYCERTGCSPEYRYGFDYCGLLLVFTHTCPDNSLSILWKITEGIWEGLFMRSAI